MADKITAANEPPRAARRLHFARLVLLGGLVGLIATLGVLISLRRSMPALDARALQAAQQKWEVAQVLDYQVEIAVQGAQPATYSVEVRAGEPVFGARNQVPFPRRRSWETWTVPGMFDTLASDVETLQQKEGSLVVRCEFDPTYGYPLKYERIELGTGQQSSWVVTKFEPL